MVGYSNAPSVKPALVPHAKRESGSGDHLWALKGWSYGFALYPLPVVWSMVSLRAKLEHFENILTISSFAASRVFCFFGSRFQAANQSPAKIATEEDAASSWRLEKHLQIQTSWRGAGSIGKLPRIQKNDSNLRRRLRG